jgi:hypothetical protein
VGASGVIYVNPGLSGGAPNSGDSFAVLMIQAGLLANTPESNLVAMAGTYPIISDLNSQSETLAIMPQHWTTSESTAYQGAGADATPSQWDVTDSAVFYGLVWSDAVDTSKEIDAVASNGIDIDNDFAGNWGTSQFEDSIWYVGHFKIGNAGANGWIQEGAFQSGAINSDAIKGNAIGASELAGDAADEISDSTWAADTLATGDSSTMGNWQTLGGSGGAGIGDTTIARVDSTLDILQGGNGANLCSIFVYNGSGAISNATITMTKGSESWDDLSDSAGWAVFNLDNGTWYGTAYKTANTQDTIPQTFSISAAMKDTITMSTISIGSPGSATLCSVYIYTYDMVGDSIEGATFRAVPRGRGPWIDSGNVAIIPSEKTATTDSTGYAALAVYRSHVVRQLQSDGTQGGDSLKYDFILTKPRHFQWKAENRVVPDSGSWWAR